MNIFWFVVGLVVLVIIHEAGHMVVARWCGMRVERFSVFMGRPLVSWTRGETEYGVGWLPIGGYVKITGMLRNEEVPPEVEPRAYYNAPVWKRIATILAGPGINIILAVVLFVVSFWLPGAQTLNRVDVVSPDSPALAAGLQQGDRLVSVNGIGEGDLDAARRELQSHPGGVVTVQIDRDGRIIDQQVRLQRVETEDGPIGLLGIQFDTAPYGFVDGLREGTAFSWEVVEANISAIGQLVTSEEARDQVNSVVGVGAVYNQVADDGWIIIVRFFALVSLALGIFNLFPLLPLDGGHIVMALIEKLRGGRPVSPDFYMRASFAGFAVLLLLTAVIMTNDFTKLFGDGFDLER
ncbi:MAG: RIP metalloprotease [Thermoleophilia bacterium]